MFYDDDARDEAIACGHDEEASMARDAAIESCMDDPEFVWKWRLVNKCKNPKRIKHLAQWCEDYINEGGSALAEAAAEAADPYGYRGLSRADF
jgi:hypothetical protein